MASDDAPPTSNRRKRRDRKSREGELNLSLLVSSVQDYAIFMLDPEGRVATWNPGAERLKGYSAEEIIGQHFSIFYPPEDLAAGKPAREIALALSEGRVEDEEWRVRKDGSLFWANVVVTAIYGENHELRGFAKITRDLTEQRRAEQDRLRLAKAEETIRLRDEFLSIASHELRTPMNALNLYLQGALRLSGTDDRAAVTNSVEKALRQVGRVSDLIDGLLDVSRIAEGKLSLRREPLDLRQLVADAVDSVRGFAEQSSTEIRVANGDGSIIGQFDRVRVEQLVTNLLHNAIKYGRGAPVDVEIAENGVEASLAVVDHGIGIPEPDRRRIFARFERAASALHFGGLGLGLYICKSIAEAHGGSISVESSEGQGSTFTVRLPLREPESTRAET